MKEDASNLDVQPCWWLTFLGFFKAVILSQPLGIRHINIIFELWVLLQKRESLKKTYESNINQFNTVLMISLHKSVSYKQYLKDDLGNYGWENSTIFFSFKTISGPLFNSSGKSYVYELNCLRTLYSFLTWHQIKSHAAL